MLKSLPISFINIRLNFTWNQSHITYVHSEDKNYTHFSIRDTATYNVDFTRKKKKMKIRHIKKLIHF